MWGWPLRGRRGGKLLVEGIALDDHAYSLGELPGAILEAGSEGRGDDLAHLLEVLALQPTGGERGGADAQAGGLHRGTGVEGDGVAVDGDADVVQAVLPLAARELGAHVAQIGEHEVHVGAA